MSESQPLLTHAAPQPSTRPFPTLYLVATLSASLLAALLVLSALLVNSFIPSDDLANLASSAITVHPSDVHVLNFTRAYRTCYLQVSGKVGIDASQLLGISDDTGGAAWWESLRRNLGHRAISAAGPLVVAFPQPITVYARGSPRPLLNISITDVIDIPLHVRDSPLDETQLDPFTYQLGLDLLSHTDLVSFATKAWTRGSADVDIHIPHLEIRPGQDGWTRWIKLRHQDIRLAQKIDGKSPCLAPEIPPDNPTSPSAVLHRHRVQAHPGVLAIAREKTGEGSRAPFLLVPDIPGLPKPTDDLAQFITLESYAFHTSRHTDQQRLRVSAMASARNPFPSVRADFPLELGFGVFLPAGNTSQVKMADVVTMPIKLRGQETVRVHIEGIVHPGSKGSSDDALSGFLHNYLAGRDNNVTIRGLAEFPCAASPDAGHVPPEWVHRLLPAIHAVIPFPGPQPPPELIESVTIEQMKISESTGKLRASGIVVVRARIPEDLKDINVSINGVRPDVLVSDGEAYPGPTVDPAVPPYPPRAFGRIHPDEYLPAVSERDPTTPGLLTVRAPLHDVPIDILPGRDKVLSDFIGKIVFKGSAVAGIVGNAAVRLRVVGIDGPVQVDRLPVRGVVNVGRPRVV